MLEFWSVADEVDADIMSHQDMERFWAVVEVAVVTGDDLEEFTTVGGVIVSTEDDIAEVNEVASVVVVTADFIEGKAAIAITEDLKAVDKADSGMLTVNDVGR